MQTSYNKDKKNDSSVTEGIESGEILSSSSEWKIGLDNLFVTYLNEISENKIKPIKITWIFLLMHYISIRSRLVSQPKIQLISNSEQLINTTDLSPITFDVI